MKYDWKKAGKQFYLPNALPELIEVPAFRFFTIEGKGNPNDPAFAEYIGVLYALAYSVRMSPKQGNAPEGYYEYTVFPLEGVWDIDDDAKRKYTGKLDKDTLVFKLMIRQPSFVNPEYAKKTIEKNRLKKPGALWEKVAFEEIEEGKCIQMMHLGSYDSEPESFRLMDELAASMKLSRTDHTHREIYMSDPRKVKPEKLKTVLRYKVH